METKLERKNRLRREWWKRTSKERNIKQKEYRRKALLANPNLRSDEYFKRKEKYGDELVKKRKEWENENRSVIKQNAIKWRQNNPEKALYLGAKRRAMKCNLEFSITMEDINIPLLCPYLGIKITTIQGNGLVHTNASIDRIDNSMGYVKGNVQVISTLANFMKRDATIDQLRVFAKNILTIHGDKC